MICLCCISQRAALTSFLWLQFCASSLREAEEWVKEIDFVLRGPNASAHIQTDLLQNVYLAKPIHPVLLRADMTGVIPEEEEEEQLLYDDVGQMDEIYEELPGLIGLVNIRSPSVWKTFY